MKLVLALALALVLVAQAQAQAVWRCGPDGRSYSDTPCSEGRSLAAADARSDAQVQAARDVALRESRLAEQLRQERLKRDALPPAVKVRLATVHKAPPAAPPTRASRSKRRAPADPDTFRAVAPVSRQKQG